MKNTPALPTDIRIRKASPNDSEAVIRLIQQLAFENGEESSLTKEYVLAYLEGTRSSILLAECDGCVQGLLSFSVRPDLYHAGNSALIEEFVVDKAFRSTGVGSALLVAFLEIANELDCKEVCLAVMPDNERAIRFYRSHGLSEEALFLEKHF